MKNLFNDCPLCKHPLKYISANNGSNDLVCSSCSNYKVWINLYSKNTYEDIIVNDRFYVDRGSKLIAIRLKNETLIWIGSMEPLSFNVVLSVDEIFIKYNKLKSFI